MVSVIFMSRSTLKASAKTDELLFLLILIEIFLFVDEIAVVGARRWCLFFQDMVKSVKLNGTQSDTWLPTRLLSAKY